MSSWRTKCALHAGAAALGAVLLATAASAPAQAQFLGFWSWPGPSQPAAMPAPVVYNLLMRRGFRLVAPLERNGGVYLADVRDRFGRRERLVIDVYSGSILQTFAYGVPSPPGDIPAPRRYVSRYAPPGPLPSVGPPPYAYAPELGHVPDRRDVEQKKRETHRLARRKTEPKKPEIHSVSPSEASREPDMTPPASPASQSGPAKSAEREAPAPINRRSGAPKTSVPKQEAEAARRSNGAAPVHPKRAQPHPANVTGPGYANGVPIDPSRLIAARARASVLRSRNRLDKKTPGAGFAPGVFV